MADDSITAGKFQSKTYSSTQLSSSEKYLPCKKRTQIRWMEIFLRVVRNTSVFGINYGLKKEHMYDIIRT